MTTQTSQEWNQRYAEGQTPWDNQHPDRELKRVLAEYHIRPCRCLELGCGTGTNAVYLAQQGFDVTAFDVAPLAIERASARAAAAGVAINLFVGDVLALPNLGEPFPFIFDRGVYHAVRRFDAAGFCAAVAAQAQPGGYYLTLAGNANEPESPQGGPPRVSAEDMCRELGNHFYLVQLREFRFDAVDLGGHIDEPLAWSGLWRRKPAGASP